MVLAGSIGSIPDPFGDLVSVTAVAGSEERWPVSCWRDVAADEGKLSRPFVADPEVVELVEEMGKLQMVVWSCTCICMVPCHPGSGRTWNPAVSVVGTAGISDTIGFCWSSVLDVVSVSSDFPLDLVVDVVLVWAPVPASGGGEGGADDSDELFPLDPRVGAADPSACPV